MPTMSFAEIRSKYAFLWLQTDTQSPRWEQAMSADGGQSWETNWTMDLSGCNPYSGRRNRQVRAKPLDLNSSHNGFPPAATYTVAIYNHCFMSTPAGESFEVNIVRCVELTGSKFSGRSVVAHAHRVHRRSNDSNAAENAKCVQSGTETTLFAARLHAGDSSAASLPLQASARCCAAIQELPETRLGAFP